MIFFLTIWGNFYIQNTSELSGPIPPKEKGNYRIEALWAQDTTFKRGVWFFANKDDAAAPLDVSGNTLLVGHSYAIEELAFTKDQDLLLHDAVFTPLPAVAFSV